jgi:hypothetical protein
MTVRSSERLFNLSLVERAPRYRGEMNGTVAKPTYANKTTPTGRNFYAPLRVVVSSQQRISVVGNGNFNVGKKSPTRKPGQPIVGTLPGNDSSSVQLDAQKTERPRVCGAMTQQCGDSGRGNSYAPQKFVHLVGCRDTTARPETWVRPRPAPPKQ